MRNLALTAFILLLAGLTVHAFEPVWLASNTATADTTKILCLSQTYMIGTSTSVVGGKGILHGVCVNDTPGLSGTVTVYNSSSTAVNPVAVLRSTAAVTAGCQYYDVTMSSGLVYTNSAANNVTFLYACY